MCFSATASFSASSLLLLSGVYCSYLAKKQNKNYLLFSLIPVFFGLQQFIEGVIWIFLNSNQLYFAYLTSYIYLFFAFYLWPIYIPLSLYFIERKKSYQRVIRLFIIIGAILGSIMYIPILFHIVPFSVTILKHSIDYKVYESGITLWLYSISYVLILTLSLLYSPQLKIKIFGLLVLLSFLFSYWVRIYAFTSVWCFFAAILSIYIIYIVFSCGLKIQRR